MTDLARRMERAFEGRAVGSSRAVLLGLAACIAGTALFAATVTSSSAEAATSQQTFTIYSVATQEQFLSMSDDRARGKGNTPFGNFKDTTTPTKESGVGPYAGDIAMFSFDLYTSAALTKKAGSGVFTCQYNFNQNAFCDVTYQLKGGILLCAGAFNFNAKSFTLTIKGGTGVYRSKKGDIDALPAVNHAQRLNVVFS
jgi:hypothetical protein